MCVSVYIYIVLCSAVFSCDNFLQTLASRLIVNFCCWGRLSVATFIIAVSVILIKSVHDVLVDILIVL